MAPTPFRVVIVGGGPAGIATALALIQQQQQQQPLSSPLQITLLELRETVQTLGGAVNLTPLALRYLDSIGAGKRLRSQASPVSAIELVGHRLGNLLVKLWPNVDAVRVQRQVLVETLLETLHHEADPEAVRIEYGAKITSFEDFGPQDAAGGGVRVKWINSKDGNTEHVVEADLLIGCDGIHSQVRREMVEADRPMTYTGRCSAYGYAKATSKEASQWKRSDGKPLIKDTTLVQNGVDSLLITFHQPLDKRDSLFLAALMPVPEPEGSLREGWTVLGADKEGLKQNILSRYKGGPLTCLPEILDRCQEWFFFPIYMLPQEGTWSNGRVQLLGDAAHAMPPQGESTGVALEDGILMAHVLSRRDTRTVPQMLADFEKLRRHDITEIYKTTMRRFQNRAPTSWLGLVAWDWLAWIIITYINWTSDHFGRDVRLLNLPE